MITVLLVSVVFLYAMGAVATFALILEDGNDPGVEAIPAVALWFIIVFAGCVKGIYQKVKRKVKG